MLRARMTDVERSDLLRLLAALPQPDAHNEVILRPDGDRPLAMVRTTGAAPRAFVLGTSGVEELLPAADPELPAAHLFEKKSRMLRALAPALPDAEEARLVAWRPGKRAVVRVRAASGTWFVKFLDRKTWRRAERTFARLAHAPLPLVFARASALLPEHHAYVAPGAPGTCLRDLLAGAATTDWTLLDAAVRALQATPIDGEGPRIDFASARDAGVRMLQKGAVLLPELAPLAARLAALQPPATVRAGFVHGDLHDRQLFLTADRVHLIDLEGVGHGDATFDLVNLAEQARLRALQQSGADDGICAAMLDRFALADEARLRWGICVRARLCGVYALRPRWGTLTARLASEVDAMLLRCDC
jgi:hypothetical protein